MFDFTLDDLRNSKTLSNKVAGEISKNTPKGLRTSRSVRGGDKATIMNTVMYSLSEAFMGIPAVGDPRTIISGLSERLNVQILGGSFLGNLLGGEDDDGTGTDADAGPFDSRGISGGIPDAPQTPSGGHMRLSWGGYTNGNIPTSAMVPIRDIHYSGRATHYFEPTAGKWFQRMIDAAKSDGVDIKLTDSFRSFQSQWNIGSPSSPNYKGNQVAVATPGTSIHGWGKAVDVANGNNRREWIQRNGMQFGWIWPDWARRQGTRSWEPWHFEFWGEEYIARPTSSIVDTGIQIT